MSEQNICWCGNKDLLDFSPAYFHCTSCGTLVLRNRPDGDLTNVQDKGELYSQDYYLKHLPQEYGYPSLEVRAQADLSERILFWIETLLRYKVPPSKILELGSAHGGFVAMLRQAGFDAAGLELSPWLVKFSKDLFDIPVYQGPLENQEFASGSLDAIVLMDVLEHLPDPLGTMQFALDKLSPSGILLIQTPQFPEAKTFHELEETHDAFLAQFKEKEHLFLFSARSIQQFFSQLNCATLIFEPAIFAHYDMFFVVSRVSLTQNSKNDIREALQKTSRGRIMQAFLELYRQERIHLSQLQETRSKFKSELEDARAQLQKADLWLREAYTELQVTRQALAGLRTGLHNSRLYKIFRSFGIWAWMDNLLDQVKQ